MEDLIPTAGLLGYLRGLLDTLHPFFGAQTLSRFEDWHEHDGFVTNREIADWDSLRDIVTSIDSLCAASPGDDYVASSYYPESRGFLLRFYTTDDCTEIMGTFDFSADRELVRAVHSVLSRGNS